MKAVVVVSHGKVEVREVPMPEPGPYEALVEIEACGLCGTTDRHIVEGHQPHHSADAYPAILGHEAVGMVVQTGAKVKKFQIGDRVTRPTALWPGTRRGNLYSAWGGFAEYGLVRDVRDEPGSPEADYHTQRQHVVPKELSVKDAVAAISLAEVASWMEKLGDLKGKTLAIGGTGFAACVMSQCARVKGARRIIAFGRNPKKFEWVKRNGATDVLLFDEATGATLRKINQGEGADWFLDAAGHQKVFEAGLSCLKVGGRAGIYGAPDGFNYRLPLGAAGGDFSVHYLAPTDDTFFQETCRRLQDKTLDGDSVRTHVWKGLESINQALREQESGEVLKGLIMIR